MKLLNFKLNIITKVNFVAQFFKLKLFCCFVVLFGTSNHVLAQADWVQLGPNNELVYKTDSKGNHIMDFSTAGYMVGGLQLPLVPAKLTLSPTGGDDLLAIQNAIDQLTAMPLVNGFRGAVVLSANTFFVSGTININASGVVLGGSGSGGTLIESTGSTADTGPHHRWATGTLWNVVEGPFLNDMLGDVYRWKNDGILSVIVQNTPKGIREPRSLKVVDLSFQSE